MTASEETKAIAEAKKKAGNEAFGAKDYGEALRLYSEAIDLDPSNCIYRSNRSACYVLKGNYAKAKEDAEACIRLNPDFVKGYYRLATALMDLGETVSALEAVQKGLSKDSKNGDLLRLKRNLKAKQSVTAKASAAERGRAGSGGTRGGGGGTIDRQTLEEFQELSVQVGATKRELAEVEAKLQTVAREIKRGQLTGGELEGVEDATNMYQSVGKMFLLRTKEEITTILGNRRQEQNKAETQLQAKQSYLEKRLASEQGNLDEIIKNIQAQA
ncbi:unnamed protein product [Ascophyllum nodosum]